MVRRAPFGLRLSEARLGTASLERLLDGEHGGLEIHVLPPQSEGFTLPQPEADSDRDETFEPVARDGVEQRGRLFGRQRLDLPGAVSGRVGQRGDIARDEFPPQGLIQRRSQHVARAASGVGAGGRLHAAQTRGDVLGRESGEPDALETGHQVRAHDLLVAFPRPPAGPGPA